jgi:YVTN family beta-propeller protein
VLTAIDVSGDSNSGNKVVGNTSTSVAFDYNRTTVYTTNTAPDSLTQIVLNTSTAGFSANTTTISLPSGSTPIGMSFQYFGSTYTLDYEVNSKPTPTCPSGGSLGAVAQATAELKATICLGGSDQSADPVFAWIYRDQSKVFVLDNALNQVYVVSASKFKQTNTIAVGSAPTKAAQSADGYYIYVLNSGDNSISIIDGQAETLATGGTVQVGAYSGSSAPLIDIAQNVQYNDTVKNVQYNHVWVLQKDGTVSVFDASIPGTLTWLTSIPTMSAAQIAAGAVPTNLALMRDGTEAYVGIGSTSEIVAIDTSKLSTGSVTSNATTAISVGVPRRGLQASLTDTKGVAHTVTVEDTTSIVTDIAVSRGGSTADLSKVYATTTSNTTYYCYDSDVNATDCDGSKAADVWDGTTSFLDVAGLCTNLAGQNAMSCPNLYNGTAVVTAAANGSTPINTYVTTIPTPAQVTYCDAGTSYDGRKNCPVTTPTMVLGRS